MDVVTVVPRTTRISKEEALADVDWELGSRAAAVEKLFIPELHAKEPLLL